mmetsp:Transcript_17502/g.40105  ORF Transcript_17502/g.40105 Transcript_17502/m.40105 type:complete len:337 (-) Transcript_17502:487-1497(-)
MGALIPSTLWALALLHAPLTSPRAATAHRPLAPPRRTADAPTAPSARPETSRVDVAEASPVISDGRGHAEADGVKERSALVLGWFYATPRELEYVRKLYTRNGYTHVVVLPSVVQRIAKPRGWYRTIRQHTPPAHLGRHFDVVHCLSGGFLSMYVLRSSGVPITYSSLVLDSTPILPKVRSTTTLPPPPPPPQPFGQCHTSPPPCLPTSIGPPPFDLWSAHNLCRSLLAQPGSYTRFTRAYMRENGLAFPLKLLPTRAHEQLVEQRWKLGLRYIKLRHALLRKMGREEEERVASWTSGPAAWALNGVSASSRERAHTPQLLTRGCAPAWLCRTTAA